ncbi:MAG: type II toxin-antitoxin system Phd/YefM family antitoxin [Lentisphaeria bacterium]|nr:type II toxin-antitoxin system Phd/YefM family antitoxin [Lentisphaeria bacterium]
MKTVNFTEFRRNASALISAVERGETVLVIRHGRPVAEVSPFLAESVKGPSWHRPGPRLAVRGLALSQAVLQERETSE